MSTELATTGTKAISQFLNGSNPFENTPAIYMIKSVCESLVYVGATKNVRRRFWEYRRSTNDLNLKSLEAIQNKGVENFTFSILEYIENESSLDKREQYWIALLKPNLNKTIGGKGVQGRKLTDEQKAALSKIAKKQWENHPQDIKDKIISQNLKGPHVGHEVTPETREKLRQANLGKKQTPETIRKRALGISASMIGNKNGNKAIVGISEIGNKVEFSSAKEAADALGVHPSSITGALKGRRKTSCGYKWTYKQ